MLIAQQLVLSLSKVELLANESKRPDCFRVWTFKMVNRRINTRQGATCILAEVARKLKLGHSQSTRCTTDPR